MSFSIGTARIAAVTALGIGVIAPASAQKAAHFDFKPLAFRSSGQRDMWHTVTLVSAGVALAGILTDDGPLTVLGAAGVIVSLVESDSTRFRYAPAFRGIDFVHSGPISFGVSPFGLGFDSPHPAGYLQLTFRF
jgi:hypothetical protein